MVKKAGNAVVSGGKTYSSFASFVSQKTAQIKETVNREMCTAVDRISDKLEQVDWKKVGMTAAAIGAMAAVGVAAARR